METKRHQTKKEESQKLSMDIIEYSFYVIVVCTILMVLVEKI